MPVKGVVAILCLMLPLSSCALGPSAYDADVGHYADEFNAKKSYGLFRRNRFSIWRKLRAGFRMDLSEVHENEAVEREIGNYQRHPRSLELALERSAPYLHYVISELRRRRMPTELALLPVVESAYDPFAYSSGRASGIWQFIPSTARYYNLEQNWWYDGRRDVRAATDAALRYLQDLNEEADGNWFYALAGYNAGFKAVSRAISRNRRRGLPVRFWDLRQLPRETRIYVPRFFAVVKILSDPEFYGFKLPPIKDAPYFRAVNVGSQIDLAKAAELADITTDEIYALNAGFNRWTTPPQGPHELLLPVPNAKLLENALEELDPRERLGWTRYVVASGDSLGLIADRFNTEVEALKQLNGIENSNLISVGDALLIPSAAFPPGSYGSGDEQRAKESSREIVYKVRRNDSLWSIAKAHGIRGYGRIARWNDISLQSPLQPGQKLVLRVPDNPIRARRREPIIRKVHYVVRRNETLSQIAQKFEVKLLDLQHWNSLDTDSIIQPGQVLVLYMNVTGK